jgi:hypothetical protein
MLVTLFTFALHLAIGDEPANPVDVLAAMASLDTGCISVIEVYRVEQPTPRRPLRLKNFPARAVIRSNLPAVQGPQH